MKNQNRMNQIQLICDFYGLTFDSLLKSAEAVDQGSISLGDFFEIAESRGV